MGTGKHFDDTPDGSISINQRPYLRAQCIELKFSVTILIHLLPQPFEHPGHPWTNRNRVADEDHAAGQSLFRYLNIFYGRQIQG